MPGFLLSRSGLCTYPSVWNTHSLFFTSVAPVYSSHLNSNITSSQRSPQTPRLEWVLPLLHALREPYNFLTWYLSVDNDIFWWLFNYHVSLTRLVSFMRTRTVFYSSHVPGTSPQGHNVWCSVQNEDAVLLFKSRKKCCERCLNIQLFLFFCVLSTVMVF